jgi:hypothetical protein
MLEANNLTKRTEVSLCEHLVLLGKSYLQSLALNTKKEGSATRTPFPLSS